jgi:hypothetical protein
MTDCSNLSGSLHALLDMRAPSTSGILCPSDGVGDAGRQPSCDANRGISQTVP